MDSAGAKEKKLLWIAVAVALLLIFGGVFLHIYDPTRGEPLEPAPAVAYPPDVPEEEDNGIPPDVFDEGSGDEEPKGSPL